MTSYHMNRRQKERYKTWSKYLKSIDIYKDQDFFLENFNKIDFSFTNVFGIRFFKDRYSFFLDEKIIEKLSKAYLDKFGIALTPYQVSVSEGTHFYA